MRSTVPQGVGWKTEFVRLECKEERKLERGMLDGWRECRVASDVRPFKRESRIKADHGQPDASSPCQPQGIYQSFFSNFCCFTQFLDSLLHAQPQNFKIIMQKKFLPESNVNFFYLNKGM